MQIQSKRFWNKCSSLGNVSKDFAIDNMKKTGLYTGFSKWSRLVGGQFE